MRASVAALLLVVILPLVAQAQKPREHDLAAVSGLLGAMKKYGRLR